MDTIELSRAWRAATADLSLKADFAPTVVRAGRRYQARRRLRRLTAIVAAVVLLAGGTFVVGARDELFAAADPRLTQPTGGDLAQDTAFLADAVRIWRANLPTTTNAGRGIYDDPRSAPHVYWAGTTAAGPTAVVLQRFYFHQHGKLGEAEWNQLQTVVGLVATDQATGALGLLFDQYQAAGLPGAGAFRFGPGDRTVLLVRRDVPIYYSGQPITDGEGRVTRDWSPLAFPAGVAVVQVPADQDPQGARALARDAIPARDDKSWAGLLELESATDRRSLDQIRFTGGEWRRTVVDHGLPWTDPDGYCRRIGTGPAADGTGPTSGPGNAFGILYQAVLGWGGLDLGATTQIGGRWCVVGGRPDGTTVIASEIQEDAQPSHLFAVLTTSDGQVRSVNYGGVAVASATLPVAIRLQDGQGWFIAAYGQPLAYRVSTTSAWVDAGTDAALLPASATQVRVGAPAGPANPTTVDLR